MLDSEIVIFKKKIKMLEAFKGKGTELISVYIPPETDRGAVMGQLSDEMSQSSNIKSPQTRKNVQGALKRISNFLKQINFNIPPTGLVVFSGNVSEKEGVSDIRLFTVHPPNKLKTKLYWCDSEFHLVPLKEMATPTDTYALIAMDKREATIALLIGKKYDIMAHYTSAVPGKTMAGGQSAHRFERLREEAAQDFYKRISEKVNQLLIDVKNLKGIIVGGPGGTKLHFLEKDMLDYRLKPKILGTVDITYTDESGIREIIQRSGELLKESEAMKEKQIVQEFFTQLAKNSLGVFGEKETEQALMFGKVKVLLISEAIEWEVIKVKCTHCGKEKEMTIKNPLNFNINSIKCEECASTVEIIEEIDYLDYMLEKSKKIGADMKVISRDTEEGEQFYKGFSGIGAILRFK